MTATDAPAAPNRASEPLGDNRRRAESRPASRARRRRKTLIITAAIALIGLGVVLYLHYAGWESTDDAQIDGYLNPITSRIGGYIIRVGVDNNVYVKTGTVLAEIDPTDSRVALQSAQAAYANSEASARAALLNIPITSANTSSQLQTAGASVRNAEAGIAAAQRSLEAARATLAQAEANDAKAQDDVSRYRLLVTKEEIAQQRYVQAVNTAKATSAAVEAARASVAASATQVTQSRARLTQAEAEVSAAQTGRHQVSGERSRAHAAKAMVEQARAAVQQAKLNLGYARITAPVDGIIARRSVQIGQYIAPGQELMSVVQIDNVWVTANFKETQLKTMRPGQPVVIHVDTYNRDYRGHVLNIAGGSGAVFSLLPPENAPGNYVKVVQRIPVKITFDQGQDPNRLLRPGMSVEPKVRVK
jgi:membrane fusion protein (multidrug efflux system)